MAPLDGDITARNDGDSLLLAGIHDETCDTLKMTREILEIARRVRDDLERFRPLIDAYAATGGGAMGIARMRRAARGVRT